MSKPLISIIIPFYNAKKDVIFRCLDSIYNQELKKSNFEVICVDDCSPTNETLQSLERYKGERLGSLSNNMIILHHSINKRQGGARNTGIKQSSGDYILFLDHDDEFVLDSLKKIELELTQNPELDILFFDFENNENSVITPNLSYRNIPSEIMSGRQFFKSYEIPWTPWQFAYKRNLIIDNDLNFVEGHLFEDADFVLKATLNAKYMKYIPLTVVRYCINPIQTSKFTKGQNNKIEDIFFLNWRVREIALHEQKVDPLTSKLVWNQYYFRQKTIIMKYLWRADKRTIKKIVEKYPTDVSSSGLLLKFSSKYSNIFILTIQCLKPIFPLARRIYLSLKKR